MRVGVTGSLVVSGLVTIFFGSAAVASAEPHNKGWKSYAHERRDERPDERGRGHAEHDGASAPEKPGNAERSRSDDNPPDRVRPHTKKSDRRGVGNSGTIKIVAVGADTHNDNEPHPGCTFRVDFYGFDAGTMHLTVRSVEPTTTALLRRETVSITRSARGNTFQTSRTYDVSGELASFTPKQQGYHLRVDVRRSDANGQGSKTKVFWLNCQTVTVGGVGGTSPGATSPSAPGGETRGTGTQVLSAQPGTLTGGGSTASDGSTALNAGSGSPADGTATAPVASAGGSGLQVLGIRLAFTGASLYLLIMAGLGSLIAGAAFLMTSRRRSDSRAT